MKAASFCAFGVAGVAGLVLALATTPWLLVVGAACFASGWFYSAGPRPYGYAGFGEIFVFVFFGLVAVIGTAYLSLGRITDLAVTGRDPSRSARRPRCWSSTISATSTPIAEPARRPWRYAPELQADPLVLRVPAWSVRSPSWSSIAFWRPLALIALLAVVAALPPVRRVLGGAEGRDLITALAGTGMLQLAFGALLALGIVL